MDDTHFTKATTARGQALAAPRTPRVADVVDPPLRRAPAGRGVVRA